MPPYPTEESKKNAAYAKKILPIRKMGNYLLCVILLGNVSVNSLISILMADTTSGFIGFLISTFGITILGEIIPQSLCTRFGLAIGANTLFLTKFYMVAFFPIAYPISQMITLLFGNEPQNFLNKIQV